MSKSECRHPQITFNRGLFENRKGTGTSFQATSYVELFDESFSFVILCIN